jgi:protein required for attachment to host cells
MKRMRMMKKTPIGTQFRSQMVDFSQLGMKEAAAVNLKLLQDIRMMKKKRNKRNMRRIPRRMKSYTNSSPSVRWS